MHGNLERVTLAGSNRLERDHMVVLQGLADYWRESVRHRSAQGVPTWQSQSKVDALEWALLEITKSRAAIAAAMSS